MAYSTASSSSCADMPAGFSSRGRGKRSGASFDLRVNQGVANQVPYDDVIDVAWVVHLCECVYKPEA